MSSWTIVGSNTGDGQGTDRLGIQVAINGAGDRIAASATFGDENGANKGEVLVYEYDDVDSYDQLGDTIGGQDITSQNFAINNAGSRIAYGSHKVGADDGEVNVYEYDGVDSWDLMTGGHINPPSDAGGKFGVSVAFNSSGSRLVIGEQAHTSNTGRVHIYEYGGSSWTSIGVIPGQSTGDLFGISVDMNDTGDRVVVGARGNDGEVRVYEYDEVSTWSQVGDPEVGGNGDDDRFGQRVTMDGTGTYFAATAKTGGDGNGYTKVFSESGGTWSPVGSAIQEANGQAMGVSLNGDGTVLAVGNNTSTASPSGGKVQVYQYTGGHGSPSTTHSLQTRPETIMALTWISVQMATTLWWVHRWPTV